MSEDDITKTQKELLWGFYQEFRNHARHNETMRANITNYLLAASAGIVSLISLGGVLDKNDLPLTIMLIAIGLLGALFSVSHSERYLRYRRRAEECEHELDKMWFQGKYPKTFEEIKYGADRIHERHKTYVLVNFIFNSQLLWIVFPLSISFVGCILTIFVLT